MTLRVGEHRGGWVLLTAFLVGCGEGGESLPGPWEAKAHAVDSVVAQWVESGTLPGAVLHIAAGGGVFQRAYGSARSRSYGTGQTPTHEGVPARAALGIVPAEPMTPDTRFDLASVTKVLATTSALAVLVERGLVDVEAPVSRYLPDFATRHPAKDAVTVGHLLTHTSGLAQWQPLYYHADDADEAYAWIRDAPLAWPVGEGRHYSDLGFMVLGRIVEVVAAAPLDVFAREALYAPLGLEQTGFRGPRGAGPGRFAATSHGNPFEYRMVHDSTFGYRVPGDPDAWDGWRRRTLVGEVNDGNAFHAFGGVAGHAGLFSTAADVDVLLRLWSGSAGTGGQNLISPATRDTFLAPRLAGQALGWWVPDGLPEGSFTHTGFTGTWVLGVPDWGLRVVLLTNRQHHGVDGEARYPDLAPLQRALTEILAAGAGSVARGASAASGPPRAWALLLGGRRAAFSPAEGPG